MVKYYGFVTDLPKPNLISEINIRSFLYYTFWERNISRESDT